MTNLERAAARLRVAQDGVDLARRARDRAIVAALRKGTPQTVVARQAGITRDRVRLIARAAGITSQR